MALDQYFEEAMAHSGFNGEHKPFSKKWQSDSATVNSSDDSPSGGFDCNICLDSVQDPVVTLCGHLFCWPCIYKWLHFQTASSESKDQQQLQCPVCKAGVSQATLVPLYGRGQTTKTPKSDIAIPRRPLGPAREVDTPTPLRTVRNPRATHQHHQSYRQAQPAYHHLDSYTNSSMLNAGGIPTNVCHPVIGMFGEMVSARVFGNSTTNLYTYPDLYHVAGTNSPRLRRHLMQADKSLSRICYFLFCCVVLCLLLF